jgi:hypothetical protein
MPSPTTDSIRAYFDQARALESPELRKVLDQCRADNARRFKTVNGVVQFHKGTDRPIRRA